MPGDAAWAAPRSVAHRSPTGWRVATPVEGGTQSPGCCSGKWRQLSICTANVNGSFSENCVQWTQAQDNGHSGSTYISDMMQGPSLSLPCHVTPNKNFTPVSHSPLQPRGKWARWHLRAITALTSMRNNLRSIFW